MTTRHFFVSATAFLLAAVLWAPCPAEAGDNWNDVEGSILFGEQYFFDTDRASSAKFEQYRDVPNGPVAEALTLNWEPVDRVFFTLNATDIGQRDQAMSFAFGKEHLWRTTILWQENPRLYGEEARSIFAYQGNGVFTLPDNLQDNVENEITDTAAAIIEDALMNAGTVDLGYQRKTGSFGLTFFPTEKLTFSLFAERERREGTHNQPMGMYRSFSMTELAAPIDYATDSGTLRGEYVAKRWSVGAEYYLSNFETKYDSITWDHILYLADMPNSATSAYPGKQRQALYPDNRLRRWTIHGSANLPGHTRVSTLISQGRTEQDDAFLPFTIQTDAALLASFAALDPTFVMPSNLGGKHDTNVYDFKVVSRPVDWLTLKAFWKEYDYRNKSRSITIPGYIEDDYGIGDSRRNLPYDYDKTTYGAGAKVNPLDWLGFGLGYSLENMKRDWAAVTDSDEDIWKFTVDLDVTDWLFLRGMYKWQERTTANYDAHYNQPSFPLDTLSEYENFGVRRFYMTDRDRDAYSLLVQVTPIERLEFYGEATYAKNDYGMPGLKNTVVYTQGEPNDQPQHGLLDDKNRSYTVGLAFSPTERLNGWADYTWEKNTANLGSRYRRSNNPAMNDPLNEWSTLMRERYNTLTLGFDAVLIVDKLDVTGSVSHSESKGHIDTVAVSGGSSSGEPDNDYGIWPALNDDLRVGRLDFDYHLRSNLDFSLRYWYERWDAEDWATDIMEPYMDEAGEDESIFLGAKFNNYTNHIVSLLVRYSF